MATAKASKKKPVKVTLKKAKPAKGITKKVISAKGTKGKKEIAKKAKPKITPKVKTGKTKISSNVKAKSPLKVSAKSSTSKNKVQTKTSSKSILKPKVPGKTKAKGTVKSPSVTKTPIATKSGSVSKIVSTTKKAAVAKAWMKPLDDRILVQVLEEDTVTPGGIIIVDPSIQPDNVRGTVLSVGRGHQTKKGHIRPVELHSGDKIVFSKYAGDKVSKDGVNFVIIRESEVLGLASN